MKNGTVTAATIACFGLVCAGSQGALAQDNSADRSFEIEEIVVTAEKRETTVQKTPISITAFTGAALTAAGIESTEELAFSTPGLIVQRQVIGKVILRGVGAENLTVGGDPGVAIHYDGVYIARSSVGIFDFFDVERVEVLRGPQGTLYGRNATGGVINILSRQPTTEFEARASIMYGNYDKFRAEAAISGPIIEDKVFARLSLLTSQRDGFTTNLFPGAAERGLDKLDSEDLFAGRAQFRIEASDTLSIDLRGDVYLDRSNPPAYKYLLFPLPWMRADWPYLPFPNTVHPADFFTVSQGFEFDVPGFPQTIDRAGRWDQFGLSAKLTWDLANVTVTSQTAYREIDFEWLNDGDGIAEFLVNYFQVDASKQFTEELQISSAGEGKLEWIIGGFFLHETGKTFLGIPLPLGLGLPLALLINGDTETNAYAIFGQGTYNISDKLSATFGLRYNYEKKETLNHNDRFFVITDQDLGDSWDALTPKFGLDYAVNDDTMIYASVTRGFKSGGFNVLAIQESYNPEFLWSYEGGIKTNFMDGRVQANLSIFYYDYTDLQVGKVVDLSAELANAAEATISGGEFELKALLTENFQIELGIAYLDAEFDKFLTEDPGNPQLGTIDLAGNTIPRSPKWTVNAAAHYTIPLDNGSSVTIHGEWQYQDKLYFSQFNRDIVAQEDVHLLNARAVYEHADGNWWFAVFGKNLTNEVYFSDILESGVVVGEVVPQAVMGARRTYGVQAGVEF